MPAYLYQSFHYTRAEVNSGVLATQLQIVGERGWRVVSMDWTPCWERAQGGGVLAAAREVWAVMVWIEYVQYASAPPGFLKFLRRMPGEPVRWETVGDVPDPNKVIRRARRGPQGRGGES